MRNWYRICPDLLDDKRLLAEQDTLLIMARTIAGHSKGWAHATTRARLEAKEPENR